ncbi:MAG: transcription-repair coupling factor [Pirellulales bacterium]|nr:transcription-repair coupling factor [Pirellulales bacterium]
MAISKPRSPRAKDASKATAESSQRLLRLAESIEDHSGFADVIASLREGHGGTIGGTWGSGCALAVASLQRLLAASEESAGRRTVSGRTRSTERAGKPRAAASGRGVVVAVLPHAADVEAFADDLAIFTTADVVVLPAVETIDDDLAGSPDAAARLAIVKRLTQPGHKARPQIVVTSMQALLSPLDDPREISASTRLLEVGGTLDPAELADWLVARGWQGYDAIEMPGSFARRGGIMDLFAADWDRPIRVELFGNEIESLRTFDIVSQRSVDDLEQIEVTALARSHGSTQLTEILPEGSAFALVEPMELADEAGRCFARLHGSLGNISEPEDVFARIYRWPSVTLSCVATASLEAAAQLAIESVERFTGVLDRVREELENVGRDQEVWIVCPTEAETSRLGELLAESRPAQQGRLHFAVGHLSAGFRLVPERLVLISAAELFRREDVVRRTPKHRLSRAIDTFLDLQDGDYVVHVSHGIGRYRGLKLLEKQDRTEEFLDVEFAEGTRVYVPAACIDLVQKYVGGTKLAPKLAKIGGRAWEKQKQAVREAVADMAADMLRLQARRESRPGVAFPADTQWQEDFEAAFPYDETPDQLTAVYAIRDDMQKPQPMDRLLCGDVGFGKTELAMRAAFKAVDAGHQVAVLVPTTVLAEQHRRTFAARFAEYPFEIRSLSRMASTAETREILEGLAAGTIDIVIGTHRVAGADVHFARLGLVVIDEEQRFGVEVKERLKAVRASVDVLTMTATPIPRTLHMAMLGIRDISSLATPPTNRQPVETRVARWDDGLIRHAIERELARGGQVFVVHNRIKDIHRVREKLARIVPDARVVIAHGRLNEHELEDVMLTFVRGEADILLATTIIESGLDIPRANTIFIDEADHYGLADLHQLRGRVGRSHHRAYCYMLIDQGTQLTEAAARRLRAIQEFSSMGAGFSLSMRDLEIRGAGNLLGTQQSGHIAAVGYDLYCKLLEQAVRGLKHLPPAEPPAVAIDLPGRAFLPRDYIPDIRSKIDVYRRLSRAGEASHIDDIQAELADRFGPLPDEARRLCEAARVRVAAASWGIDAITRQDGLLVFTFHDISRRRLLKDAMNGLLRIVDERTAAYPLAARHNAAEIATPDGLLAVMRLLLERHDGRPQPIAAETPAGPRRRRRRRKPHAAQD